MRTKTLALVLVALAFAGCGGDDESTDTGPQGGLAGETAPETDATQTEAVPKPAEQAKLYDGENFNPNDVADCLLDSGVGAAVSLDGAAIDLHDAQAQVIVEKGNADILVYDDATSAKAGEEHYRSSFGDLSEVGIVRNVLWQTDPDASVSAVTQVKACLGVSS